MAITPDTSTIASTTVVVLPNNLAPIKQTVKLIEFSTHEYPYSNHLSLFGRGSQSPRLPFGPKLLTMLSVHPTKKVHYVLYSLLSNNHYVMIINFSKIGPPFCPY